jgi:hypothetical protein
MGIQCLSSQNEPMMLSLSNFSYRTDWTSELSREIVGYGTKFALPLTSEVA